MTRKVYVKLTAGLILDMEEGIDVSDVIDEMDYTFVSKTDNADIIDTQIRGYEIEDSK